MTGVVAPPIAHRCARNCPTESSPFDGLESRRVSAQLGAVPNRYMMSETKSVSDILLQNYDRMLLSHGDTARGANWPNEADRRIRFDVMLDVIASKAEAPTVLCDLGCGTGELLAHIRKRGLRNITYIGVDRSAAALSYARAKFPDATFIEIDVNSSEANLAQIACDYLIANGLFTVKWEMTDDQMWSFLKLTISRVWPFVRRGVAFNVMSKIVDSKRDDLFHLAMDAAASFLHELAGRRVRLRADYGLFEYTAFAYKPAKAPSQTVPVFRPQLPRCRDLLTYLRRIDATRIYSNHGPLLRELERRLSSCLGMPSGGVKCASSGTNALIGAIFGNRGSRYCITALGHCPGFYFCRNCGGGRTVRLSALSSRRRCELLVARS